MNKFTYLIVLLMVMSLCLAGCSEEFEPTPLTYSKLLSGDSSKTWRLTGYSIVEEGKQPLTFDLNDPSDPDNCVYDELYTFYADEGRTFEISQGEDKCIDGPDIYYTGSWSIVNANATVNFGTPLFGIGGYTIKRLTERSMTVELFVNQYNFAYRLVFTAQND
ncbi:hypothetical protein GXP67_02060 [Rhodocytophaga rosea]|uniref:Lipocalin-like domain-containing protein n=1 Tax=Rhodocytophaga rosea TaxID=2704465 RepID=A0A6C0GC59_9BACT|nr:lipocalin family protein [Rhodocytophaga rosea]QHT65535.1 hypothetical protein GXP67_02060 [Rhodocytophaga rosea]